MTPEILFTAALQLEAGWEVKECRFEGEPRKLILKLDFESGKRFNCPACGKKSATHDTSIKRWRHRNFFQYECHLEARVPRSNCPEHGVLSVAVPWAREGSGFTLLFEAMTMLLAREMPMAAVSEILKEQDTRLWRVAAHYVEEAHAQKSWAKVRHISVDETSSRRGHRYVTNILDADTHKLLLMIEGRSAQALQSFAKELQTHGGNADQIQLISMDMSPAYQKGAHEFFPKAEIVFDHFHLMQMAGEALDKVRKQLAGGEADFKGSLWAIRGNEWTRRLARGFRSLRFFRIMAYLKASNLSLNLPSLLPT